MAESAASDEIAVSPTPPTFEDAGQAISQGKRHLLVRDYGLAVATLAEGVGMLANQHGEMADELAEPYLLYGKALLFLAREEAGVLGSGVPGAEDEDDEDEKDEAEEESAEKDTEEGKEDVKEAVKEEAKADTDKEKEEPAKEEKKPAEEKKTEDEEEKKTDEPVASGSGTSSAGPSGSSSSKMNGEASTSGLQNGDAHDNSDDDGEDDEEDDANNNLRIAWEVLELAKIIFTKRGPTGWKFLADVHRLLGEVSMEGGNQPAALIDLNACLELLQKIEPVDPRSMAETHYQLGLAHSLGNEFDASIEQFLKATSLLEQRIRDLESSTEETAVEEIKELKELLPEIQDKITDMRDFKTQAAKMVIEKIKSMNSGSCSNGAGPSGEGSSSSSSATTTSPKDVKPASDISHLVRKKRKQEDGQDEETTGSPCKKPLSEKSA